MTVLDLQELLRTHFRVEMMCEEVRQRLSENPVFTLKNAFEVLDYSGRHEVSFQDIRTLFNERGVQVSDKEVEYLINKFDQGLNRGLVNHHQFLSELVPKCTRKVGGGRPS